MEVFEEIGGVYALIPNLRGYSNKRAIVSSGEFSSGNQGKAPVLPLEMSCYSKMDNYENIGSYDIYYSYYKNADLTGRI